MTWRYLILGDGYEAGDPRLGGKQVIVVVIQSFTRDVVTDVKQLSLRVEQKAKIHRLDILRGLLLQILKAAQQSVNRQPGDG